MSEKKPKPKGIQPSLEILQTPQEIVAKVIENLAKGQHARMFSEYSDKEIMNFAMLEAFNIIIGSPLVSEYINACDERRVSLKRRGRLELVAVARSLGVTAIEERSSIFDRLLRRRRF